MNTTYRTLLISLFLLGSPLCGYADDERFAAYLDGLVAGAFKEHKLAGMTFVLVRDEAIVLSKGYGYADLDTLTPVDPATHLFRPGSVSKLFTWTAVMQLVEQGRLDLHTDLGAYVSQFELPNRFDTPMTMAHIMTHTPGLEDGALGYLFGDSADDHKPLAQVLETYMPTQVRRPGEHAAYSNWATALAGLVVANISGISFEDYVKQNIFEPLDMEYSTFEEPLPEHLSPHMSTGYVEDSGRLEAFGFEFIKNFGPAGAMSGSGNDMGHFMIAHLNQGRFGDAQILQPATIATMHSQLASHSAQLPGMGHGFIEESYNNRRFIGHRGDTIAFHSQLLLDPEQKFGFYMSFNAPDGAAARNAIAQSIVDYFYPPQIPRYDHARLDGTAERISQVAGTYRFNRRSYTKLEAVTGLFTDISVVPGEDDTLIIQGSQGAQTLIEIEPDLYQVIAEQRTVQFKRDVQGTATHLLFSWLPIIVADRLGVLQTGSTHQLIIGLALLAALFVLVNYSRNRNDGLEGHAARARLFVSLSSASFLLFVVGLIVLAGSVDVNEVVFNFPLPGTGVVLSIALLGALFTALSIAHLPLVWASKACNRWAALRYSYVCAVFGLFVYVLHYWNLLGWNYY